MTRIGRMAGLMAAALALTIHPVRAADPGETKIVGNVVKIEMASPEAKEAIATLRSRGQMVPIVVQDELTLNKFRIKKIQPGDEIRCLYKVQDGKNLSVSFRKTAGC